ncbi:hypothetical protein JB92DRAFT_2023983 [Gautieria morchelliformis]|nr:hypothetical protein JB92DRAFT_2023983 [Gautieria morchelliformis]
MQLIWYMSAGSLSVRQVAGGVASAEVAYAPDEEGFFKRQTDKFYGDFDAELMGYNGGPFKREPSIPTARTLDLNGFVPPIEESKSVLTDYSALAGSFKRDASGTQPLARTLDLNGFEPPIEESKSVLTDYSALAGTFKRRTAKRFDSEEMNYDGSPFKREPSVPVARTLDLNGFEPPIEESKSVLTDYSALAGTFKRRTAKRFDGEEMNYDGSPFKREPSVPVARTLDLNGFVPPIEESKSVLTDYSALAGTFKRDASGTQPSARTLDLNGFEPPLEESKSVLTDYSALAGSF